MEKSAQLTSKQTNRKRSMLQNHSLKLWPTSNINSLYQYSAAKLLHVINLISQSGTGFISGHADGTIVRFYVAEDGTALPQVHNKLLPCLKGKVGMNTKLNTGESGGTWCGAHCPCMGWHVNFSFWIGSETRLLFG